MKTIAIMSNKGGVGKTASAVNLAHILSAEFGKRVLAVDIDPQGNMSNLFTDVNWQSIFYGIINGDIQKREYMIDDMLLDSNLDPRVCVRKTDYPGLDIIPSFLTLSEVEERLKADVTTPQQFRLKIQLEKLQKEYDYCIIDCSPSVSILNVNALVAADEVLMPTRCDAGSLVGIAMTSNLIRTVQSYNFNLKIAGCFFTQWQERKRVAQFSKELLANFPQFRLLPINIGVTKFLEENTYYQKPLLEVDKKRTNKATKAYLELASYLVAADREKFLAEYKNAE